MVRNFMSSIKARIGRGSNNNIIIQESQVDSIIVCDSSTDLIKAYGEMRRYDLIGQQIKKSMLAATQLHPLYPDFGVRFNNELARLVSAAETEDAFKKFPKVIKGTFRVDYKKYPFMVKSETPWEYAYRTQTSVELCTTAYQEYLGNTIDPFPATEYADGMKTIISAPEFPPALEATVMSGETIIPILLRRKPCMEHNKMIIGTISNDFGFALDLITYADTNKTDFTFTKVLECDLRVHLQRERLLDAVYKTKCISMKIGSSSLVDSVFEEDKLMLDMFENAQYNIKYLESLMTIEKHTSCKFNFMIKEYSFEEYKTVLILASSLENKWHQFKGDFDNSVRLNYENIPEDFEEFSDGRLEITFNSDDYVFYIQGQKFRAERYMALYKDAQVNNIGSVMKNRKHKKKDILLTFRPIDGKGFFHRYCRFESVKAISEE